VKKPVSKWVSIPIILVFCGLIFPQMLREVRLLMEGTSTQATVTRRWLYRDTKGTNYKIRYFFQAGEAGREFVGEAFVSRTLYESLQIPEQDSSLPELFQPRLERGLQNGFEPRFRRGFGTEFQRGSAPQYQSDTASRVPVIYVASDPSINDTAFTSPLFRLLSPLCFLLLCGALFTAWKRT
jgi:hypothetical protein